MGTSGGLISPTPGLRLPADHGMSTWTFDPALATAGTAPTTAGRMEFFRVQLSAVASVTNIVMFASVAGGTLTAGQCFASLHTSAGALVGVTADQAANWASGGTKEMALVGGPYNCAAGGYIVGFWYNGTTSPTWMRAGAFSTIIANVKLTTPNFRFGFADTGLTTTAPNPLAVGGSNFACWWGGLS